MTNGLHITSNPTGTQVTVNLHGAELGTIRVRSARAWEVTAADGRMTVCTSRMAAVAALRRFAA